MNLTKKQIKSLLEVLSNDDSRRVLTRAYVQEYKGKTMLVATNSYILAALHLQDNEDLIVGSYITREDLTKWYKLADNKSRFTERDVKELAQIDDLNYPKWQSILDGLKEVQQLGSICFQARYAVTLETLVEAPGLEWTFYGKFGPMMSRHNNDILVLMPLKS